MTDRGAASAEDGWQTQHFTALDSLRGICALCVVLFHFRMYTIDMRFGFVAGARMFVDFFFVLSGFVLAWSYGHRLAGGFGIGRFFVLRMGRIYPLHLALLLVMVAFEVLALVLDPGRDAFSGNRSLDALASSLLMVQIFQPGAAAVWNGPSWSIAAEMWTYLIFAFVCRVAGASYALIMAVLAALALAALATGWPGTAVPGNSLLRCIAGFGLGVLVLRHRDAFAFAHSRRAATLAEAAIVVAVILFVSLAYRSFATAAPLLFAVAVWVFSFERGALSRPLMSAPLRWLGKCSYSIYMVHVLVLMRVLDLGELLQKRAHVPAFQACPGTGARQCVSMGEANGPILLALYLVMVLVSAHITYILIEAPVRQFVRERLRRRGRLVPTAFANDEAAF